MKVTRAHNMKKEKVLHMLRLQKQARKTTMTLSTRITWQRISRTNVMMR